MRLGIDCDGVLANFESGYLPLLGDFGAKINAKDPGFPQVWEWPAHHGVPPLVEQEAWNEIHKSETFWYNLAPHCNAEADIEALRLAREQGHDIYFITNRPGNRAKQQTEGWLGLYGYVCPTVLVSADKGACTKALNIEAYIDDKPSNLLGHHGLTKVFLKLAPYNKSSEVERHGTVTSVRQMLYLLGLTDAGTQAVA